MSKGPGSRQRAILAACAQAKAELPDEPWNRWLPVNTLYDGLSLELARHMTADQITAAHDTEQESWRRAAQTLDEKRGLIERKQSECDPSSSKRRSYGDPRARTIATFVRLVLTEAEKEAEVAYWKDLASRLFRQLEDFSPATLKMFQPEVVQYLLDRLAESLDLSEELTA